MTPLFALQALGVVSAAAASFLLSASAGLGGSLLMVPTLVLVLGPREGIALSALLLASNNVVKVAAYRDTIPWRSALLIVALISLGALVGAVALVHAPEAVVVSSVFAMLFLTLMAERVGWDLRGRALGPVFAFIAGSTSGFSGTSGPLKGVAIRSLGFDRQHFVGAASVASLAGDLTKSAVYTGAGLLGREALVIGAVSVPLMILGTRTGFQLNRGLGERAFAWLFWGVMGGYSARLVLALL